jgi:hypothetical protein
MGRMQKNDLARMCFLLASFFAMTGSDLPLVGKLRPFHIGLVFGLAGVALLSPKLKDFLNLTKESVIAFLIIIPQLLWVQDLRRFLLYTAFLGLGLMFFMIGRVVARDLRSLPTRTYYVVLIFWMCALCYKLQFPYPSEFPMQGGPFGNINDMATALIILLLIHYSLAATVSFTLVSAAWIYAASLDRRAALLSLLVFFVLDVWNSQAKRQFFQKCSVYGTLLMLSYLFWLAKFQRFFDIVEPNSNSWTLPQSSENQRISLLKQMIANMQEAPLWQVFTGKGLGQLNLSLPIIHVESWASPHFFWMEMYFYLGVSWLIWLGYLFLKSDRRGRIALITIGIAGCAMSSMIYFAPLYLLLGILSARKNTLPLIFRRSFLNHDVVEPKLATVVPLGVEAPVDYKVFRVLRRFRMLSQLE